MSNLLVNNYLAAIQKLLNTDVKAEAARRHAREEKEWEEVEKWEETIRSLSAARKRREREQMMKAAMKEINKQNSTPTNASEMYQASHLRWLAAEEAAKAAEEAAKASRDAESGDTEGDAQSGDTEGGWRSEGGRRVQKKTLRKRRRSTKRRRSKNYRYL